MLPGLVDIKPGIGCVYRFFRGLSPQARADARHGAASADERHLVLREIALGRANRSPIRADAAINGVLQIVGNNAVDAVLRGEERIQRGIAHIRALAQRAVDALLDCAVRANLVDNRYDCVQRRASVQRGINDELNLCRNVRVLAEIEREFRLFRLHAIVDGQVKVIFLDGHFASRQNLVLRNLRARHNLVGKHDAVTDNVVVHSVILHAGT